MFESETGVPASETDTRSATSTATDPPSATVPQPGSYGGDGARRSSRRASSTCEYPTCPSWCPPSVCHLSTEADGTVVFPNRYRLWEDYAKASDAEQAAKGVPVSKGSTAGKVIAVVIPSKKKGARS